MKASIYNAGLITLLAILVIVVVSQSFDRYHDSRNKESGLTSTVNYDASHAADTSAPAVDTTEGDCKELLSDERFQVLESLVAGNEQDPARTCQLLLQIDRQARSDFQESIELQSSLKRHRVIEMPGGRACDDAIEDCTGASYWSYDQETLKTLAYSDAQAAQVLGHRLLASDPESAKAFFLRAAAISGRAGPVVDFSAMLTPLRRAPDVAKGRIAYERPQELALAAALNEVAKQLGYPIASDEYLRELRRFESDEAASAALDDAQSMLDTINAVRTELGLEPLTRKIT